MHRGLGGSSIARPWILPSAAKSKHVWTLQCGDKDAYQRRPQSELLLEAPSCTWQQVLNAATNAYIVLACMLVSSGKHRIEVIDFEIKLIQKVKARYCHATAKNSSYQNGNQKDSSYELLPLQATAIF